MEQLRDRVRSKVDEMRAAGYARGRDREQLLEALSKSLPADAAAEPAQRGGAIHLCPWHTCQATRHG